MILKAFLAIGIAILVIQGAVFLAYHLLRTSVLNEARGGLFGHPGTLYLDAVLNATFIWVLAAVLLMAMACLYFIPFIFLAWFGIYYWYQIVKSWRSDREEKKAILLQFPVPKLQFRIQDSWVAAGVYGVLMLVLANVAFQRSPINNIGLAVTAIVFETTAFLIAMDVCRQSKRLNDFWPRACCIIAVMVLAAIPPMILIEFMAWKAWNYALWKAHVPIPGKKVRNTEPLDDMAYNEWARLEGRSRNPREK